MYHALFRQAASNLLLMLCLCWLLVSLGCQEKPPPRAAVPAHPTTLPLAVVETEHLHNAKRVTDKVINGGQPEGEQGFKDLAALGIKTIISVDGTAPDVELAHKYGMRYVHLPFGYNTVPEQQGEAIAKAILELPGPIYIHCHHGKHRSPAAVAVACVYNGTLSPDQAESVLKTFGTGENYKGLWKSAKEAAPRDPAALRAMNVSFVEKAPISALADAMVGVDQTMDRLKLVEKSAWRTPKDHPDVDPPHEALQLEEHYREIARLESVKNKPAEFQRMLNQAEGSARALKELLSAKPVAPAAVGAAFKVVGASCTSCHKVYRD